MGQKVYLTILMSFLLRNEYGPEESGVDMSTPVHPVAPPLFHPVAPPLLSLLTRFDDDFHRASSFNRIDIVSFILVSSCAKF